MKIRSYQVLINCFIPKEKNPKEFFFCAVKPTMVVFQCEAFCPVHKRLNSSIQLVLLLCEDLTWCSCNIIILHASYHNRWSLLWWLFCLEPWLTYHTDHIQKPDLGTSLQPASCYSPWCHEHRKTCFQIRPEPSQFDSWPPESRRRGQARRRNSGRVEKAFSGQSGLLLSRYIAIRLSSTTTAAFSSAAHVNPQHWHGSCWNNSSARQNSRNHPIQCQPTGQLHTWHNKTPNAANDADLLILYEIVFPEGCAWKANSVSLQSLHGRRKTPSSTSISSLRPNRLSGKE